MTAFYNEIDPYCAVWLRKLIDAGLIAPGEVDERSIEDIRPDELSGYTQCHFFAGIGGWSLALRQAGWPDDRPVWTGSCPCQPFSAAGNRGGTDDERHLWPHFRWLIDQCRPATVFGEQVASKDGRVWLAGVRSDLEAMGYQAGAADLCAAGIGAPHIRQRLWWVCHAVDTGLEGHAGDGYRGSESGRQQAHENRSVAKGCPASTPWDGARWIDSSDGKRRRLQPGIEPLAHGVPARVGRLRAYGNAIVPQVATEFIAAAMEI